MGGIYSIIEALCDALKAPVVCIGAPWGRNWDGLGRHGGLDSMIEAPWYALKAPVACLGKPLGRNCEGLGRHGGPRYHD